MKKNYLCRLEKKSELIPGIFDFTVYAPEISHTASCGQFLHILCSDKVFLRRPISICDVYGDFVRFIFEVKGDGTKELSFKKVGDNIDIMGPLGNSFIEGEYKNPVVIGGGIGIFPLFMLTKKLENPTVFLGFRDKSRIVIQDEFSAIAKTYIATDNGSYGYDGFAADMLKEYLRENDCGIIYSCGPAPMLKAIKTISEQADIPCRVSLEQRMGCGIGACLVCSCETIFTGVNKYKRVCKDGPVFWSSEVIL